MHMQYINNGGGEDDSYFVSLSDLLVGLLFIFIIILMAFAIAYRSAEDELTNTEKLKEELLTDIQTSLKKEGVEVQIDIENGVLHLPESILFTSGSAYLNENGKKNVQILARTLSNILPCYTYKTNAISESGNSTDLCGVSEKARGRLDTVFIEGHTDDVPVGKKSAYEDNWDLSQARATYIYKSLTAYEPKLDGMLNRNNQPVMSISAYAERRPRSNSQEIDDVISRSMNRRIDMRFLMVAPKSRQAKSIDQVRDKTVEIVSD